MSPKGWFTNYVLDRISKSCTIHEWENCGVDKSILAHLVYAKDLSSHSQARRPNLVSAVAMANLYVSGV